MEAVIVSVLRETGETEGHAEIKQQYQRRSGGTTSPAPRTGHCRRQLALGLVAVMYGRLGLARALRSNGLSDETLKAYRAIGALAARDDARK
jgi:hypothetical protein